MKLAERAGVGALLVIAIGAGASLFAVTPDAKPAYEEPEVVVIIQTPTSEASCPAFAREQLRLEDARVRCVLGHFGEPAWFVIGDYTTTEPWQRLMVISEDGTRVLVPRTDRPTLRPTSELAASDVDGDGNDEIVNGRERIRIADDNFLFAAQ